LDDKLQAVQNELRGRESVKMLVRQEKFKKFDPKHANKTG
jgi:hypothetical protein